MLLFFITQNVPKVWIGVVKTIEAIGLNDDDSCTLKNVELQYYTTSNKRNIFSALRKCEGAGSTKKKKIWYSDTFDRLPTTDVLCAVKPGVYCSANNRARKTSGGTTSNLLEHHVQEATRFACVSTRWADWLAGNEKE